MELDSKAGNYQQLHASFRWQVPALFNIAQACCGRWAADRSRFALYYEDKYGFTQAWTFWDIQRAANRLSNALGALGTLRGERIAIILPQRPETAIAHIACNQMGAIAVPLSPLLDQDALEYRLSHSEVRIAMVDEASLPNLWAVRERLPHLKYIIGVGGSAALETGVHDWSRLLEYASPRYTPLTTAAADPALIIYTSGTIGNPKGVLMAQRTLLGSLPGFVCSHDFFPQPGDMFWSPADWGCTDGLFDALLPAWGFGQPILAYRGRFDPEKAYWLIKKYAIRNTFLSTIALKMMMTAVPKPREKYGLDPNLRSLASSGEAAGDTLMNWAKEELGVTINEVFGQTEINYLVGGCAAIYPPKPGALGRPYPGHHVAVLDQYGQHLPVGEVGEICVQRSCNGEADPAFLLEYWKNSEATRSKFFGAGSEAWCRTGSMAKCDEDGYLWNQGRADDHHGLGAASHAALA
ncbi:MAG: AMP-binding protein [Sterolibacterium sp.]|nr:AMP-binding protein [Sterolibacterium sp.]